VWERESEREREHTRDKETAHVHSSERDSSFCFEEGERVCESVFEKERKRKKGTERRSERERESAHERASEKARSREREGSRAHKEGRWLFLIEI